MRKIMALVLCTVLLVTVTGCSGTEKQAEEKYSSNYDETDEQGGRESREKPGRSWRPM